LNILIVKLSSLGDVVHAMAAVQDIQQAHPKAQIDWVVERGFAPLVRRCQGVHRAIECDLRRWRTSLLGANTLRAWHQFKTELQQESYDAVIDLQGLSKSALVSWLAQPNPQGLRYSMANQTEGSGFEAPSRWVADVAITLPTHCHAITRSRQLCAAALGYAIPSYMSFGLVRRMDKAQLAIKIEAFSKGLKGVVALVHGTSRTDKQWPLLHWRALADRLHHAGYGVVVPHGNEVEKQTSHDIAHGLPDVHVWPNLPLDALTDALSTCTGVIGVDSGLSHIAVALNLPHVQIYNFDTAWRTGPLALNRPRQCSVFATPTPSVDAVWQAWERVLFTDIVNA
jgi:heptosyltransferase-1